MQTIAPDFDRMIDLPGVGPCPRPVDIDQSVTGFADLVSLRIYSFAGQAPIEGEAEDDEVLIVLLDGAAAIAVSGAQEARFELTVTGTRAIYLPPDHHYRLLPQGKADVAYARAKPRAVKAPQGFAAGRDGLVVEDYADRLQMRLVDGSGVAVQTRAGSRTERLVHALGTNAAGGPEELAPWHTLALSKGETHTLASPGHVLIVAAT